MRKFCFTVCEFTGGKHTPMVVLSFPVRSGSFTARDGKLYHYPGNEFDSDDATLERMVVENFIGRELTDDDIGKSFAIQLGEVTPLRPTVALETPR